MVLSVDRAITAHDLDAYLEHQDGGSVNGSTTLPVHLGKTPEESSRDLLYWAILEVARDVKELKAYLTGGVPTTPATPLPVYPAGERPIEAGTEVEFCETGQSVANPIKTMDEVEREAIIRALEASDGHRKKAAKLLDMAERTLYRKIRHYGL